MKRTFLMVVMVFLVSGMGLVYGQARSEMIDLDQPVRKLQNPLYDELHYRMEAALLEMKCFSVTGISQDQLDAEFASAFGQIKTNGIPWLKTMSDRLKEKSNGKIRIQLLRTPPNVIIFSAVSSSKRVQIELRNRAPFFYRCEELN